jgi:CheY-like chemotaxis protein
VIVIALLLGDYDADCRVTMMSDYYGRSFARTHLPVGKSWQVRGKLDGWEVAQHAREIEPDFPVVYMSGAAAADWTSIGVPNSIMLAKPFAPAQLLAAVSNLLNSATPTT